MTVQLQRVRKAGAEVMLTTASGGACPSRERHVATGLANTDDRQLDSGDVEFHRQRGAERRGRAHAPDFIAEAVSEISDKFIRDYQSATGKEQFRYRLQRRRGYDSALLLAAAIRQAGNTEGHQIREALEPPGTGSGVVMNYVRPFTRSDHAERSRARRHPSSASFARAKWFSLMTKIGTERLNDERTALLSVSGRGLSLNPSFPRPFFSPRGGLAWTRPPPAATAANADPRAPPFVHSNRTRVRSCAAGPTRKPNPNRAAPDVTDSSHRAFAKTWRDQATAQMDTSFIPYCGNVFLYCKTTYRRLSLTPWSTSTPFLPTSSRPIRATRTWRSSCTIRTSAGTPWRWWCARTRTPTSAATSPPSLGRGPLRRRLLAFLACAPSEHDGDLIFFQGHSVPGVYARAFMLGRLSDEQMDNFRQEPAARASRPTRTLADAGLLAVPDRVDGPGPLCAIYSARFIKYLASRK